MKKLSARLSLLLYFVAAPALAKPLVLDPVYLRPDGAIMTMTSGQLVDPYFPTKALLLAQDNGMDISTLANGWINWMLAHQNADGLFSRYCFKEATQTYEACAPADADDAMLAMWIELLYRMSPRGGLPPAWKISAEKAEYRLNMLFNKQIMAYSVSPTIPSGLLMDNIEIYAAYKRIARESIRIGDSKKTLSANTLVEYLKNCIMGTFWDDKNKRFLASTQERTQTSFYPDTVVQLIPMLHHFENPKIQSENTFYKNWMKHHQKEWFSLIGNEYPWGMLAVLATNRSDINTANCWLQKATPYRNSAVWNVLDETAYQIVQSKLPAKKSILNLVASEKCYDS